MIEINLLPKNLRNAKRSLEFAEKMAYLKWAIIVSFLAGAGLIVLLFLALMVAQGEAKNLEAKFEELRPEQEKIAYVTDDVKTLERKIERIQLVTRTDISWARLLTGLNRGILQGIWLSELEVRSPRGGALTGVRGAFYEPLVLKGFALGESDIASPLVADFLTGLKNEENFSRYFRNVELDSMRSQTHEGQDVMMFVISCEFKEGLR